VVHRLVGAVLSLGSPAGTRMCVLTIPFELIKKVRGVNLSYWRLYCISLRLSCLDIVSRETMMYL
jgi:hypothetical protein